MPFIIKTRTSPATARTFLINGVLLATLAAAAVPCIAAAAHRAPFKISQATTYFTAPVLPSGRINYVAAINAMARRGVTAKNNAGVLVARTFPAMLVNGRSGAKFTTRFYKALEEHLPPAADRNIGWSAFAKKHGWPSGYGNRSVWSFAGKYAAQMPWTTAGHPRSAAYLRANRHVLRLLRRASVRSQFYMPMLTRRPRPANMLGILLPNLSTQENEGELLARSAMHSMGDHHGGKCAKTIVAIYRLAALEGRQPMFISLLVSHNLSAWANRATQALLKGGELNVLEEKAILHGMETLPRSGSMAACVGHGFRFLLLDGIERMAVGDWHVKFVTLVPAGQGIAPASPAAPDTQEYPGKKFFSGVRWNQLLKNSNNLFDEIVNALHKKTYARRRAGLKNIDARVSAYHVKINPPPWVGHRRGTTAMMQKFFWSFFYQHLGHGLKFDCQATLRNRVTEIGLALAIYRAGHGHYPANLAALAPRYLKRAPNDPFTSKPLIYEQEGSAYVLYGEVPHGKNGWRREKLLGGP